MRRLPSFLSGFLVALLLVAASLSARAQTTPCPPSATSQSQNDSHGIATSMFIALSGKAGKQASQPFTLDAGVYRIYFNAGGSRLFAQLKVLQGACQEDPLLFAELKTRNTVVGELSSLYTADSTCILSFQVDSDAPWTAGITSALTSGVNSSSGSSDSRERATPPATAQAAQ